MATHTVQFREQHAHPHGALWDVAFDAKQLLDCHREHQFIVQRRQVVHARDVRATLHVRQLLGGLLHTGVQISDDRLAPEHGLTLQLKHETQHAVRARVLWTHVDDHRLVFSDVLLNVGKSSGLRFTHAQHGTGFAQQFLRSQFTA